MSRTLSAATATVRTLRAERNQLGLSLRIAAVNLRRLVNVGLVNDGGWRLGEA